MQNKTITCWYCEKPGHVKADCHLYKKLLKDSAKKPTGALTCVPKNQDTVHVANPYLNFLSKGVVVVEGNETPITILRDTGTSLTLLSSKSLPHVVNAPTVGQITVKGVNGDQVRDLKEIILSSDLISGEFAVGLVQELPMEGVDLLLGNDLMGGKVWAE